MSSLQHDMHEKLAAREREKQLRTLFTDGEGIDFITNDYLGFSRLIHTEAPGENNSPSASRLLGGNSAAIESFEKDIAAFHGFESALYYNSGYTANLGLFSCILSRHDTFIYDEYIHASIRDGIRLSPAQHFSFAHNSIDDLEEKIKRAKGRVVVAVEAVYSMDGDTAPLVKMAELCARYNAGFIVDEAHSIGLYGKQGQGLVHELGLTNDVLAVVYTYGKAMGAHGGAVMGHKILHDFQVNFSRPFIYTTAPAMHQVQGVKTAYSLLQSPAYEKNKLALQKNMLFFTETMENELPGSAVQASHINRLMVGGVAQTIAAAAALRRQGYHCRPVLSPTVEKGAERIRINLHAFNTLGEISGLIQAFKQIIP